jgi:hypothetical protein
VWSPKDFDMVEAGLAQGWGNERMAQALGCGVSTLKRNFGPLLRLRDAMPDRLQLTIFAAAVRKAMEKGDMGAIRQVRAMMDDNERRLIDARMRKQQTEVRDKPEKLGKKEAAQKAARELIENAGAEPAEGWGDLLTPGTLAPH